MKRQIKSMMAESGKGRLLEEVLEARISLKIPDLEIKRSEEFPITKQMDLLLYVIANTLSKLSSLFKMELSTPPVFRKPHLGPPILNPLVL